MGKILKEDIINHNEAKKLLRLIIATWPDCNLHDIQSILKDATNILEDRVEEQIVNRKKGLLHQTAIKDFIPLCLLAEHHIDP